MGGIRDPLSVAMLAGQSSHVFCVYEFLVSLVLFVVSLLQQNGQFASPSQGLGRFHADRWDPNQMWDLSTSLRLAGSSLHFGVRGASVLVWGRMGSEKQDAPQYLGIPTLLKVELGRDFEPWISHGFPFSILWEDQWNWVPHPPHPSPLYR